jgi:hypothetical protein
MKDLEGRSAPDAYGGRSGKVWRYKTADNVAGIGALVFVLGLLCAAATFMSWMEFGTWTEVLTYGACITAGLLILGAGMAWLGDRKADQWRAHNLPDHRSPRSGPEA